MECLCQTNLRSRGSFDENCVFPSAAQTASRSKVLMRTTFYDESFIISLPGQRRDRRVAEAGPIGLFLGERRNNLVASEVMPCCLNLGISVSLRVTQA